MSALDNPKDARGRPKSTGPKPNRPTYASMVAQAINIMGNNRGSSASVIKKYILTNFDVADSNTTKKYISLTLKRGIANGSLVTVPGHAGTFCNSPTILKKSAAIPKIKKVASSNQAAESQAVKKTPVKTKKISTTKMIWVCNPNVQTSRLWMPWLANALVEVQDPSLGTFIKSE